MRQLAICVVSVCLFSAFGAYAQSNVLLEGIEVLDPALSVSVTASWLAGDCTMPGVEQWSVDPGLIVECWLPGPYVHDEPGGTAVAADGTLLKWTLDHRATDPACPSWYLQDSALRIYVTRPGTTTVEAIRIYTERTTDCDAGGACPGPCGGGPCPRHVYGSLRVVYDVVNGVLFVARDVTTSKCAGGYPIDYDYGVVAISGFARLFDTFLSFSPDGQTLSLQTGVHPDGFSSADAIQVWTGDLESLPDWSQAKQLACTAASNPIAGQPVTVADTLPAPPLGEGRYYVTATAHGSNRRLGRQYFNGAFSARDPGLLPICVP